MGQKEIYKHIVWYLIYGLPEIPKTCTHTPEVSDRHQRNIR